MENTDLQISGRERIFQWFRRHNILIGLFLIFASGVISLYIFRKNTCILPYEPDVFNFHVWMEIYSGASLIFTSIYSVLWFAPEVKWVLYRYSIIMVLDILIMTFHSLFLSFTVAILVTFLGQICSDNLSTGLGVFIITIQPILLKFVLYRIHQLLQIINLIRLIRENVGMIV